MNCQQSITANGGKSNADELLSLAKSMRDAQKQYWEIGLWESLKAARELERQFDDVLEKEKSK
jgi:hypothetical protein